jgi:2-polyprenyl-6-methoxyphenol hydroxylase-like FAD-dependent oxidoreductase
MAEPHFKVLIAGGGPVGLFAAHIFHKAGIEFELLERNDTVIQEIGATVNLWPMSTRIVYQLGLGEVLEPLITETDRRIVLTQDGIVYDNCPTAMRDL